MTQIFLLNAKGCSGRAIKLRELSASEVDQCSINASKTISESSTNAEYVVAKHRSLNYLALVGVTTKGKLKTLEEVLALPASDWAPLTQLVLESGGPLSFASLFNAKDDAVISGIVQRMHLVSAEDIEAIMGKALDVSEG